MAAELLQYYEGGQVAVLGGGLSDTRDSSRTLAQSLKGFTVYFIPGKWNDRKENASSKAIRFCEGLEEIIYYEGKIDVSIGISAGGPPLMNAVYRSRDTLKGRFGKATAVASPFRAPERMTPKLWFATQIYPALRPSIAEFVYETLPGLDSLLKEGRVASFMGARDGRVPKFMSVIPDAINVTFPTPTNARLDSHSRNIRGILGWDRFKNHIVGNLPATA